MSPARIDLKVVSDRLGYAEDCVAGLRGLPVSTREEFLVDRRNAWSADSLLRRGIEAIFDTARHPEELYQILTDDLGDLERAIRELRDAASRLAEESP